MDMDGKEGGMELNYLGEAGSGLIKSSALSVCPDPAVFFFPLLSVSIRVHPWRILSPWRDSEEAARVVVHLGVEGVEVLAPHLGQLAGGDHGHPGLAGALAPVGVGGEEGGVGLAHDAVVWDQLRGLADLG